MSFSFGTYMDGVTVKISEKYAPPPPISAPSGLFERVSAASEFARKVEYDFALETNVLRKLDEWRNAKETLRNDRNHRLQLREEARQRELDRIAAVESEERLKELSVSDVSYPNADEIGDIGQIELPTPVDDILRPTPVSNGTAAARVDLLDDLDPIRRYQADAMIRVGRLRGKNVDKLTFEDFEGDTSSPFDNLELKTINDIELLAQVLNPKPAEGAALSPYSYDYSPANSPFSNSIDVRNVNSGYAPVYGYGDPVSYGTVPNGFASDRLDMNNYCDNNVYNCVANNSYGYEYGNPSAFPRFGVYNLPPTDGSEEKSNSHDDGDVSLAKSRSKSVPDIVKELDEEIAEARWKLRERSHNCSPAPQRVSESEPPPPTSPVVEKPHDPFQGLSPQLQSMCKYINGMGFPIDRVARACKTIGEDDKKIIEYLLNMGQLMDFGFPENKVAEALMKHDCNKDKALDDLIS